MIDTDFQEKYSLVNKIEKDIEFRNKLHNKIKDVLKNCGNYDKLKLLAFLTILEQDLRTY